MAQPVCSVVPLAVSWLVIAVVGGVQESRADGYWPGADTSEWRCRLCPGQSQRTGRVTAGLGGVSDSSAKFGDYTGLDDSGPYLIGDAAIETRYPEGGYSEAHLQDAGLDSRRLLLRYGDQGRYGLAFEYDRIPHFVAEGARTVFSGVGTPVLTLPQDWEPASNTRNMDRLDASLRDLPLGRERDSYRIELDAHRAERWDYGIDYRRTEQEGQKLQGANFLNSATVLPVALERVTDRVDARVSYREDRWQLQVAYHGSLFDNRIESVTWDNPFTPLGEGGDRGRLAQEPDNRFHQLLLSGSWRPARMLQTSGRLAVGRLEQDEPFLPPSINPLSGERPLPVPSLDGRVETLNGQGRALLRPNSALTLTGEVYYDDRDNRTPRAAFIPVRSDLAVAPARLNRPYSFERLGSKLRADVKTGKGVILSSGAAREEIERTFQETEKTSTTEYWGEVRSASATALDFRLRAGQEQRRFIDQYRPLADLFPAENPLLRRYHLGERDRDQARASLTYRPVDRVSLSLSLDYARDDYRNTQIGLTEARDFSRSLDVSATPGDNLTLHAFVTRQRVDSGQSGSDQFAAPDWNGHQRDTIDTVGFGFEWRELRTDLDLGLDYGHSFGRGAIDVTTRDAAPGFPDLKTRLDTLELFARYRLSEQLSLRLDYGYERYKSEDFFIGSVAPNTVANLLSAGQQSPDYAVHLVGLSVTYRF